MTLMRYGLMLLVTATALDGCAFHGLTLSRPALGCYRLRAEGWTSDVSKVVGFDSLPSVIALDSALRRNGERTVMVPRQWRFQAANENRASWENELGDWRLLVGDTLVFFLGAAGLHEMDGDSIVVKWSGWGGSIAAYLAPTQAGYAGIGQIQPRQLAQGLAPVWIYLLRMPCDELPGQVVPCSAP